MALDLSDRHNFKSELLLQALSSNKSIKILKFYRIYLSKFLPDLFNLISSNENILIDIQRIRSHILIIDNVNDEFNKFILSIVYNLLNHHTTGVLEYFDKSFVLLICLFQYL